MKMGKALQSARRMKPIGVIRRQSWTNSRHLRIRNVEKKRGDYHLDIFIGSLKTGDQWLAGVDDLCADDWEVLPEVSGKSGILKLDEAIKEAMEHEPPLRIRRTKWESHVYVRIRRKGPTRSASGLFITGKDQNTHTWQPTQADLLASDWHTIEASES